MLIIIFIKNLYTFDEICEFTAIYKISDQLS